MGIGIDNHWLLLMQKPGTRIGLILSYFRISVN
jgi:hypothetical protein